MRILPAHHWTLLVVSLLLTGCGTSTPPLAEVSGTVSYRGQPLPGGVIVFTPDPAKGSSGPLASSVLQSDGSFVLQTGTATGAAAGWHRITVVSIRDPEVNPGPYQLAIPPSLIPERYRNPDLSGLSREVHLGEKNVFQLNLD
jgi:hypothetical protein